MQLAEQHLITIYTSRVLRDEVERVLAVKFKWSAGRVKRATEYVWSLTRLVEPTSTTDACPDEDDNRILEGAIDSAAGWIVTGDRELLLLHPLGEILTVSSQQFLVEKPWKRS